EELITGRMQLGDTTFHQYAPAQVNVAGDLNDPNGPTYASFNGLMGNVAIPSGWTITQTVNRAGQVGNEPSPPGVPVTALDVGAPTHHNVASVFWSFMTSSGLVSLNGQNVQAPLFQNPFYATGYPLTEAYWTTVMVGGVSKQVLVQVFERRVLTYTPSNPAAWQVEAGNVGLHYYQWRYVQLGQTVTPPPAPPTPVASGVYGFIKAGPTCPVQRVGVECAPLGVSAQLDARDGSGTTVATTHSDATGHYTLSVVPGDYTLVVVVSGSPWPRCPTTAVTVPSGAAIQVNILCDTGIR
ncbi:MAG TPA: carboxypeptidase-like regulatory domain-containing protein, partial [Thermomicrobiaceae bacterium]|nr:carboxypeptidase-like regulatory domain-containing protein [Thermomicrobiaceae bacterium]